MTDGEQLKLIKQGAIAKGENWRDNWQTPKYILDYVNRFFNFCWHDPCPINPKENGILDINWLGRKAYINPPFSQYKIWASLADKGSEHIWLANHSHDVVWFKDLLLEATALCLLNKRVKFIDPRTGVQSDSTAIGKCQTLIYTGLHADKFKAVFEDLGKVVFL